MVYIFGTLDFYLKFSLWSKNHDFCAALKVAIKPGAGYLK